MTNRKKYSRNQINKINNNYSLVNINELELQLENTFWSGLIAGAVVVGGVVVACCLINNKTEPNKK